MSPIERKTANHWCLTDVATIQIERLIQSFGYFHIFHTNWPFLRKNWSQNWMIEKKTQTHSGNAIYWLNEHFIVINQTEKRLWSEIKTTAVPLYLIQWPIADRLATAIRSKRMQSCFRMHQIVKTITIECVCACMECIWDHYGALPCHGNSKRWSTHVFPSILFSFGDDCATRCVQHCDENHLTVSIGVKDNE